MERNEIRYPVGMQVFEQIIGGDYQYVDKTGLIHEMTHRYNYVFLSRPRRFGKSLLVSTLRTYFEGKREFFKGLAMERLETEWKQYPVIHISLASVKEKKLELISDQINDCLDDAERRLGIKTDKSTHGSRLKQMIIDSYDKYGQQVVVLIDEYDAPLLNHISDDDLDDVRYMLRALYAPLKDCLEYLRFIFITGITKFSQLSIFSELNNLANISMEPKYATICGITEKEMIEQFDQGICDLADSYKLTREQMIAKLREYYNGYHFSENATAVYNPFSLVRAFEANKLDYYWLTSGTPSYLLAVLRKYNTRINEIQFEDVGADDFDVPTEDMHSATPLLYQSGYLTITGYDSFSETYNLDYPNKEVRIGFIKSLYPKYVVGNTSSKGNTWKIVKPLLAGDLDGALSFLQRFLKSIPYQEGTRHNEGHYTAMLYVIFALTGDYVQSQVRTSDGRVDILLTTPERNYLMELKINSTAQEALDQIDSKDYTMAVTNDLPTTKVGINFSMETATITDWVTDN
ncbi:MAG: AAA family ATPase [Muribaculaceae bacterium]|nr:AAA family ATPase [Muribaculaceae bacterium]